MKPLALSAVLSGLVSGLVFTTSLAAFAGSAEQCHDLFMTTDMYRADIAQQMKVPLRAQKFSPLKGLADWHALASRDSKFAALFPERVVTRVFATEEMSYFERNLEELMHDLRVLSVEGGGKPSAYLTQTLRVVLKNRVPASSIESRITGFMNGTEEIERILGDNSWEETRELFYGHDRLKPSPESLIGQYLAKTGASSVVRTFNEEPGKAEGDGRQGPQRLAIAVDAKTYETFSALFNREDMLSVFAHAQIIQNGKIVSYNQKYGDLRAMSNGHILPGLVLKTTIAQRAEFYMNIVANTEIPWGWKNEPFVPWMAKDFCSVIGGYETCTHYIGNMPIGDRRVPYYSFPGAMDNYAQNQSVPGVADKDKELPRIARLSAHGAAFTDARLNKLYQAPGYEQLSSLIGQTDSNTRGEWANPGWLIQTLIGPTDAAFVPFVFTFQADATQPLDPKFVPKFETPL